MKFLNMIKLSVLGFALLGPQNSFAATDLPKNEMQAACDCAGKQDFCFGYIFIEPTELALLNNRPIDLLASARSEFRDQKYSEASRDIYTASQLMKVQASGHLRGSRLMETANNLDIVSQRVAEHEIKTSANLDYELTRAAHDEAEHFNLHATELWAHHMSQNVAADLTAAVKATERSAEWSGEKISNSGKKVMDDSKKISQRLVADGKWTSDEVGKSIASLGAEINRLGKKMEQSEKTMK